MKTILATLLLVITFLTACAAKPAQAITALPTVGIYDENTIQPNAVDFEASGNTWALSSVHQLIGPAYASDFGGVYQCQLNSSGRQLVLKYGLHSTKVLTLDGGAAFSFGVRNSGTDVTSISEIGLCAGLLSPTSAQESFYFNNISGGLPGERLTGLGLTILSAGRDYGTVTAEASFSDGTSAVASRHIREPAGLGDTFFGFASPFGTSITSMNLSSPSGRQFFFDDVVFMTVPEPNSITLVMVGVAAFLCLRFQALRRYADVFRRCVLRSVGR